MKISKKDALMWFEFFAQLDEEECLMPWQQEIVYDTLSQIEAVFEARCREAMRAIPGLKTLGGRTYYVGDDARFAKGCRSCLTGTGLSAVRKTNKCNAACRFCYDYGALDMQEPIGEGMWEIGGTYLREEDIELLLTMGNTPTGIAYVYLEPFMEIEKYYGIIRCFANAGVYQHLYTNGIAANEENIRALGEAGLNELRFNLGATDCSDHVIRNIAIAKKYIPMVGIETPMTPEFYRIFQQKKEAILATGVDFMNCAELHLNPNNLGNYFGENMYMYRRGYLSPMFSREISLKLLAQADAEKWPMTVHDCSNHTKFARDLNLRAKEGGWFGSSSYGAEFDTMPYEAFLPVLRDESFEFLEEEPLPDNMMPMWE